MLAYTMTPSSINLLLDGKMRTIDTTHVNYKAVCDVIRAVIPDAAKIEKLRDLIDIPSFLAKVTAGRVQVGDSAVLFDGNEIKGVIADRLIALLRGGFDVMPLARFLDRLMSNPIASARDELYIWLEQSKMPITSDGCFIAYKKVQDDYKSYHDGYTDNSIGAVLPRIEADTNRNRTCSNGYHFCSHTYLPSYYGSQGKVVLLKIAPEEVRAIPNDYNNAKGRAATYTVVGELNEHDAAFAFENTPLADSYGDYDWGDDADEHDDRDYGDGYDYDEYGDVIVSEGEDDYDERVTFDECDEPADDEEDYRPVEEEYFDPSTNLLVRAIMRGKQEDNYHYPLRRALQKFLLDDTYSDSLFIWATEPQGDEFWQLFSSLPMDRYPTEADSKLARYLVKRYIGFMDEAEGNT